MKDLIKTGVHETDPTVWSVKVEYTQKDDLNPDHFQSLIIETATNGAGTYFVIKTKRWAINNIDEMIDVLRDFKKRIGKDT